MAPIPPALQDIEGKERAQFDINVARLIVSLAGCRHLDALKRLHELELHLLALRDDNVFNLRSHALETIERLKNTLSGSRMDLLDAGELLDAWHSIVRIADSMKERATT